jgi:hypothetical protein
MTHRYLPQADAVLFVLHALDPIVESEIEFIERILEVTPNLFFVMTKIDCCPPADWRSRIERSGEVLRERFGDRLPHFQIWPISAENLRKAASASSGDATTFLRQRSRYDEVERALLDFLFHASGRFAVAQARAVAEAALADGARTLASRVAQLAQETLGHAGPPGFQQDTYRTLTAVPTPPFPPPLAGEG